MQFVDQMVPKLTPPKRFRDSLDVMEFVQGFASLSWPCLIWLQACCQLVLSRESQVAVNPPHRMDDDNGACV